jgi:hypothetical protein
MSGRGAGWDGGMEGWWVEGGEWTGAGGEGQE